MTKAMCLIGMIVILASGGGQVWAADEKPVTLRNAIAELKKEAKASLDSGEWLRSRADYGKQVKVKADADDILKQLTKRIDRNPVIDAYVKYQLTSLLNLSDYKELKTKQMFGIVSAMPAMVPVPEISPKLHQAWAGVDKKGAPSAAQKEAALEAFRIYDQDMVAKTMHMNEPVIKYHKLMARSFPSTSCMRSYVKLVTLEAILNARLCPSTILGPRRENNSLAKLSTNSFFSGLSRAKDMNSAVEKMFRKKINECMQIELIFVHPPVFKPENKAWKAGLYEYRYFNLEQLGKSFDEALAGANAS